MSEPTYLATLRTCLAQCEEALPLISDAHDKQILEDHAFLLRSDIRRMEKWERKQEKITAGEGTEGRKNGRTEGTEDGG